MKKRSKLSVITVLIGAISTIGLISIGFASWTINQNDNADLEGGIVADTLISMNGFRVKSVSTFDYGVYSYGTSSTFATTGEITYNIGINPSQFDPDTISKFQKNAGSMNIYCKFNSFYEVFEKDSNSVYVNFVNAIWDSSDVIPLLSNGNNYCFYFVLSGIDLNSNDEITKQLTFTFNNKLLVKDFGNNLTIADNVFTLSMGKGAFSL